MVSICFVLNTQNVLFFYQSKKLENSFLPNRMVSTLNSCFNCIGNIVGDILSAFCSCNRLNKQVNLSIGQAKIKEQDVCQKIICDKLIFLVATIMIIIRTNIIDGCKIQKYTHLCHILTWKNNFSTLLDVEVGGSTVGFVYHLYKHVFCFAIKYVL